jgi:hypothetical protein
MDETGWNEPDASELNSDTDKNLQKYKEFTNNQGWAKLVSNLTFSKRKAMVFSKN